MRKNTSFAVTFSLSLKLLSIFTKSVLGFTKGRLSGDDLRRAVLRILIARLIGFARSESSLSLAHARKALA
jgi:hypothetical protein